MELNSKQLNVIYRAMREAYANVITKADLTPENALAEVQMAQRAWDRGTWSAVNRLTMHYAVDSLGLLPK